MLAHAVRADHGPRLMGARSAWCDARLRAGPRRFDEDYQSPDEDGAAAAAPSKKGEKKRKAADKGAEGAAAKKAKPSKEPSKAAKPKLAKTKTTDPAGKSGKGKAKAGSADDGKRKVGPRGRAGVGVGPGPLNGAPWAALGVRGTRWPTPSTTRTTTDRRDRDVYYKKVHLMLVRWRWWRPRLWPRQARPRRRR